MTIIFNWFGSILGYLLWFFYNLVHNYGIAIVLFTIVTKFLMFPFSVKQQKTMAANSKMTLKQKELQKKYANDSVKLREETTKLYEQENFNPANGCLTTMIPFPIMIGIYYTVLYPLQNALHIGMTSINQATAMIAKIPGLGSTFSSMYGQMEIMKHFDIIKDYLTMFSPDELSRIASLSKGFEFCGLNLLNSPNSSSFSSMMWLIPVICLVSSIISQHFMMKLQPGMEQSQQGSMKIMMYSMPLISAWFSFTMPGAVGFYWIVQTLVSFVQILILNKFFNPVDLTAKVEAQRIALRINEEANIKPLTDALRFENTSDAKEKKEDSKNIQAEQKAQNNGKSKKDSSNYMGMKK